MAIHQWSTTAASNTFATTGVQADEGQAPSTINNGIRELMAQLAAYYATPEWIQQSETITYLSATKFSVSGDRTAYYHSGRRVRAVGASTSTIYGSISSSAVVGGSTQVTVSWDSGSLVSETLTISVGYSNSQQWWPDGAQMPSGTRMLFQQQTAPTGWTEETTYFNRGIRQTNSSNWTGISTFTDGFSSVFNASKVSNNHTLTESELPAHDHWIFDHTTGGTGINPGDTGSAAHNYTASGGAGAYTITKGAGSADSAKSGETGGGSGHQHTLANFDLAYVDVIIAVKD